MAIRNVGGDPTRIARYSNTKNTDRWMHQPKQTERLNPLDPDFILLTVGVVAVCVVLIWFTAVCISC